MKSKTEPATDLFRTLIENTMDVITLLDENGIVLFQNQSIQRVFGYSQEELLGHQVLDLVHPEDQESTGASLGKLLQGESREERQKLRFLHKNGEWKHIEAQARAIEDETNLRVVISSRDISENHRVLGELQLSNELFQTAFHASSNICSLSKFDTGEFIDVNPTFEKVLGWTREQALSKTSLELDIWGGIEDREAIISRLVAEGKVSQLPSTMRSSTGKPIELLIDAKILMISGFKCIYFSSVDITETKKLEEQLRHSQKMEAVGQLTGGIAHDFNNILAIIMGNLELAQHEASGDEKVLSSVNQALEGATRGTALINKLLGFSRAHTNKTSPTSVNQLIGNMNDLLAKSLTVSIKIETQLDAKLWPVNVDAGDLEDAILNLALNARDSMPKGGRLIFETANKVLDASFVRGQPGAKLGEYAMLSVRDTGIGMTPEVKEKALEPFFTTKAEGKGTGLGLSMVYGFVKRSGGFVTLYSEPGAGTSINIFLPCERRTRQVETTALDNEELPRGNETVLVVDDEKGLTTLAVTNLERLGYKVLIAFDGKSALALINDKPNIDLLFSDVIMPGEMDGYLLAIAAKKAYPALKILLTSGFTKRKGDGISPDNHMIEDLTRNLLRKPYSQVELAKAVRKALD